MTNDTQLKCIECHTISDSLAWRCSACGAPIDFAEPITFDAGKIQTDNWSLWRYAASLPVQPQISLGAGMTPLVKTSFDDFSLYAKLEYLNPTGSYKDRGTTTMMNHILSHGVKEVVEDSSGNAGASVAAYSSLAGIHASIYVPATGSASKKSLIASFGAQLMEIEGDRYAKTAACIEAAKTTTYASHAWSPYFVLGQMTVAWEVWEQLGKKAPDAIATPVGHGGLFLGFVRGFAALYRAGLIEKMPTLIAVQSEGCDPIVRAIETNAEEPPMVQPTHTVADGIIVEKPVRGKEVLRAIRDSGGTAFRVGNEAIIQARKDSAKNGFVIEPTSATVIAALPQIREFIGDESTLVVAFTGNGLKMLSS